MTSARATAAHILSALICDRGSLTSHLQNNRQHSEFQLIQEYCYGCCRWFHLLHFFINALLRKPLKQKDSDVLCLLLLGLYQIREMNIPDHAAINETVEITCEIGKPWARGLVNGVLRNYLRQQQALERRAASNVVIATSHPKWLASMLHNSWPQQVDTLLKTNNGRAPMTLRVNLARTSRRAAAAKLKSASIGYQKGCLASSAIVLGQPQPAATVPGFDEGLVSVQDEASQLAVTLLDLKPGLRVLDACSAPGGKLCHILESEHSLAEVVAIDRSTERLGRLRQNLTRLGLTAQCQTADAAQTAIWWDGRPFDRILLDAPCSATGVIRRHPDIKLLRAAEDISKLQHQQQRLLKALWLCLAKDGLLLYSTCSVLAEENSTQIGTFLGDHGDAKIESMPVDWGVECMYGRQLLPLQQNGPDGFFYCLLRKM